MLTSQICHSLDVIFKHVVQEIDDLCVIDSILSHNHVTEKEKRFLTETLKHTKFHPVGADSLMMISIPHRSNDQTDTTPGIFMRCAHILQRDVFFDPSLFGLDRKNLCWDRQLAWEIDLVMYRLLYLIFKELEVEYKRGHAQTVPHSLSAMTALNLSTENIRDISENIPNYKILFNTVLCVELDNIFDK